MAGKVTEQELADALKLQISADSRGDGATKLVVEVRASDPSSPVVGQIWLRSDL